jgi:tetratricopeptide (TPR) repeat protein
MCKVDLIPNYQEKTYPETDKNNFDKEIFNGAKLEKIINQDIPAQLTFDEKISKVREELNSAWKLFYDLYQVDMIEKQWQKQRNNNLFCKGYNYFEKEFYDNAIDIFKQLTELDPKESKYFSYLGLAKMHKGWDRLAQVEFDSAINLNPKDPVACQYYRPNFLAPRKPLKKDGKKARFTVLPWKSILTAVNCSGIFYLLTMFFTKIIKISNGNYFN